MVTVKIYAGMTGEYEVIETDAPISLIEEQLRRINELEEEGRIVKNPYDLLENEGYQVRCMRKEIELVWVIL